MTFWKSENYGDSKTISDCESKGGGDVQAEHPGFGAALKVLRVALKWQIHAIGNLLIPLQRTTQEWTMI